MRALAVCSLALAELLLAAGSLFSPPPPLPCGPATKVGGDLKVRGGIRSTDVIFESGVECCIGTVSRDQVLTALGLGPMVCECDDGANVDEDGCSATCVREYCGDGIVQAGLGEACDDGNSDPFDDCTACRDSSCGNGQIDAGEECDDSNTVNNDGCSATCALEASVSIAVGQDVCAVITSFLAVMDNQLTKDIEFVPVTGSYSFTTPCIIDLDGIGELTLRGATGVRTDVVFVNDIPGCASFSPTNCAMFHLHRGTVHLEDFKIVCGAGCDVGHVGVKLHGPAAHHYLDNLAMDGIKSHNVIVWRAMLDAADLLLENVGSKGLYACDNAHVQQVTGTGITVSCATARTCSGVDIQRGTTMFSTLPITANDAQFGLAVRHNSYVHVTQTVICNNCDKGFYADWVSATFVQGLECHICDFAFDVIQANGVIGTTGLTTSDITQACLRSQFNGLASVNGAVACDADTGGALVVGSSSWGSGIRIGGGLTVSGGVVANCWEENFDSWIELNLDDGCDVCAACCTGTCPACLGGGGPRFISDVFS